VELESDLNFVLGVEVEGCVGAEGSVRSAGRAMYSVSIVAQT
jgi:hypothetical protein